MKKRALIWSLTGISAAIGFMLTVQISSHSQSSADDLSSYLDLRTQIQEQQEQHKSLVDSISKQTNQLIQYRAAGGKESDMMAALKQDARNVAADAGMTDVSGPGITVKIQFNPLLPYSDKEGSFDDMSDQVMGQIVNLLFANGAQAISINDQRLVTTSSIRLVSGLSPMSTLQVNTVPITMPYVITALGDIQKMQAALTLSNVAVGLNLMQEDCNIDAHPGAKGVTVPAYHGSLPGQFAKEVNK